MHRDLIVFSHLRWSWVWQRPQHIVSRLARHRKVWFVEEPVPTADVTSPELRTEEQAGGVTRVWLANPLDGREHLPFDDRALEHYRSLLPPLVGTCDDRVTWLYSPLPVGLACTLGDPALVVFDVMDDLASFKDAPADLVKRHREALHRADVVFTGGRSLHDGVVKHRPDAHLFPSGVEPEHYAAARGFRGGNATPVAGYVGVIDERIDLQLVGEMASALRDWEIQMVGPVAKIDPVELPTAPNIRYLGKREYDELPQVMGGFDVALMPFALNEATRSISPTKTLEYLAAGLPVVSTPVPDVVAGYSAVVDVRDDASGFAEACRHVLGHDLAKRDRKLQPILRANHWDTIASEMASILDDAMTAAATAAATTAGVPA